MSSPFVVFNNKICLNYAYIRVPYCSSVKYSVDVMLCSFDWQFDSVDSNIFSHRRPIFHISLQWQSVLFIHGYYVNLHICYWYHERRRLKDLLIKGGKLLGIIKTDHSDRKRGHLLMMMKGCLLLKNIKGCRQRRTG